MKNNRSCPKCKSQELIITNKGQSMIVMLPVWPYRSARYRTLVCTSCGFMEDWLVERSELDKVRSWRSTYREKLMAFRRKINL